MGADQSTNAGGVSSKSSDFSSLNWAASGPLSFTYGSIAQHTNFSREEIEELHKAFEKALPHDGATTLNVEKFKEILVKQNVKSENQGFLNALFHAMDQNNDGAVNFVELCAGLSVMLKGTTKEKLALSFAIYDKDHSGKLTKGKMFEVLTSLNMAAKIADKGGKSYSDEEMMGFVSKIFSECDQTKDDTLGFKEFLTAVDKYPMLVEFK